MANKTIEFVGTSGEVYLADKQLAQGGQGRIFRVKAKSDGKAYAVKWYHKSSASDTQRQQLETLVNHGAPRCDAEGVEFIWPIEMVSYSKNSSYGYVMPLYDTERYVHYNKVINGRVRQPRRDLLAQMSYRVCMALDAVHRSGLAYCDINLGNIQFDTEQGTLIVCDNDNVIVNNADVAIAGVAEFMAPEVALGQSKPNAQTDLYSLAVLLYQLWVWEHPMEGAQTAKVRSWDQPAKLKFYAKEPLFAHHPTDQSNSATGDPMLAYSVKRWTEICPSPLKEVFIRTFTEGVLNPDRRTRLSAWQRCFMELEANASRCPQCAAVILLDGMHTNQACYHCGTPQVSRLRLDTHSRGGRSSLVVRAGALLRRHHIEPQTLGARALETLGQVEDHPKQAGAHILRNQTNEPWYYELNDQRYLIEPGQARPLSPNGKISVSDTSVLITLIPD